MPNVFIVGFERSGTTLLRRLISMWPGYEKDIVHEGRRLLSYHSRQEAENNYYDEYSHIKSGEKLPYYNNAEWVIKYIEQFREFWPDSIIFHIIRTVDEVADSCYRTFKRHPEDTLYTYAVQVPVMVDFLGDLENTYTITFDQIMDDPKGMLKLIYNKLGNIPDDTILDRILTTKEAWNHNGKRYCGLRYAASVGRIRHE